MTTYGIIHDYGEVNNTMTFRRVDNRLEIEWVVGNNID